MTMKVGDAYVDIKPDLSGFNREVAAKVAPLAKSFGGRFGKALGPVMAQQAKHLQTLSTALKYTSAGATALAAYGFKDVVEAGMKFEKQIDANAAVSEASRKELALLERQSIKLGKATFYSATEAAEAQGELIKGGLKVQQVLGGGLPAALALAESGQLELATAAETTVNAMKLFDLQGNESMSVADMLSTAANRTTADVLDFAMAMKQGGSVTKLAGYDMNETVTVLEALAEAGIKNSDAGTSMKTAITQLLKPSTKQAELTKELNLQWVNQAGNLKSAVGLSKELHRATDDMTKAERAKVLATLAGTDGVRTLNALYSETPKQLVALEKANARQGTAQEIAAKKMDNLAGEVEQFKGSLETAEIQIYKGMAPALKELAHEGTEAANRVGAVFDNKHLTGSQKVERAVEVLRDELGKIWDRHEMSAHLDDALEFAVNTAVPKMAENAGELGFEAAKGFARGFVNSDFVGRAVMATWLLHFIGGKAPFIAIGRSFGRQFGVNFASEAAASARTAEAGLATATATGGAAAWLGTDPRKKRIRLEQAGQRTIARQTAAQALAAQGGIFANLDRDIQSRWRGLGTRLARGAATWGIGGAIVGGISEEVIAGDTGEKLGAAFQGAGVGATIGTAIAPGLGTAIGAAGGAAISTLIDEASGAGIGNELATGIAVDLEASLGPQIAKALSHKQLGDLAGLRRQVKHSIDMAVALGADESSIAPLKAKLQGLDLQVDALRAPRVGTEQQIDLLRSGLATRMRDINNLFRSNLSQIDEGWVRGSKGWRVVTEQNLQGTVAAIRAGMKSGVIETASGTARIKDLLRELRLVEGRDPLGLAQGFANSWREAGRVNNREISQAIGEMRRMPKGSREAAQDAMVQMARAMEAKGQLVKGSAARLESALVTKFGQTNKQIVGGFAGAVSGIGHLFTGLEQAVGEGLQSMGLNVNSFLKALGVGKEVKFSIRVAKGAADAIGNTIGSLGDFLGNQTGGFIVPGTGSGDIFKTMVPAGSFVENREAARQLAFQGGGLVPVALEPRERVYLPEAVRVIGRDVLEARNREVPRFQHGGLVEPHLSGPEPLRSLGQAGIHKGYEAARDYMRAHPPEGLRSIGAHGSVADHPELQPAISAIVATILKRWPGLAITSTTGGGHAEGSYHYWGRAADLAAGSGYMLDAAAWIKANLGAALTEGIHNPNLSIKYGKEVPPGFWGSAVWADHLDHIHVAKQLGGLVQKLADGGWVKTGYTIYTGSGAGAGGDLQKGKGYAELGTATTGGAATGSGFIARALGRSGELPFEFPLDVKIGSKVATLFKRDRGYGQGDPFYSIDIHQLAWPELGLSMSNGKGNAFIRPASGASDTSDEHSFKEDIPAEFKGAKTGSIDFPSVPKHLPAVERELDRWGTQIKIYRKAKKAAEKANRPGLAQAITKNITAIEGHLNQLRSARHKLRLEKAKKAFSKGLGKKIGKAAGYEKLIEGLERSFNRSSQDVEQLVALEPQSPELPESATDAQRDSAEKGYIAQFSDYVNNRERPAYEVLLGKAADWRNAILRAETFGFGKGSPSVSRMEATSEKKIYEVVSEIEAINQYAERVKADIAAWRGGHPNAKELPEAIKKEIAERNKKQAKLPFLRFEDHELRAKLAELRGFFFPGGEGRISPPVPPLAGSGSLEEKLVDVQGIHWPDQHELLPPSSLAPPRVAGKFGGVIWDVQTSIEELGLKVKQAENSLGDGGGGSEDNSELVSLLKEIAERERRGRLVSERLAAIIPAFESTYPYPLPPYAGKFHEGGVVPGPFGQERTAIVKAGEVFRTADQEAGLAAALADRHSQGVRGEQVQVLINGDIRSDDPDPVQVVIGDKRFRPAVRRTPGPRPTAGGPRR